MIPRKQHYLFAPFCDHSEADACHVSFKRRSAKKMAEHYPTDEELEDVRRGLERLYELDVNRLTAGTDYQVNLQDSTRVFANGDQASQKLFTFLNKDRFFSMPTYAAFYGLLDNFQPETGVAEVESHQEKQEVRQFINAVMNTPCGIYCFNYASAKGWVPNDVSQFKHILYTIWFDVFRRETAGDSSGFEHVFVGEIRDDQIIGFHNWIQFFLEERKGSVDYKGFVRPRRRESPLSNPSGEEHIASLQFTWRGLLKPVSTSFIGVSPEYELALYTLALLGGQQEYAIGFEGVKIEINVFPQRSRNGNKIQAAFPEIKE
eukprot:CAMPEP_0184666702 /NCGR_PEP_ID=MMETSP0308-20130426/63143_1 /TAXON_ID=38269 /ORGANISM="Gloeochaete witrockiana, Strain SAG 46.84" /LENGTH=317 /DNA_ID=CAMNT_0027111421 /DNA_START=1339 /DNA_END=2292 /DNA_ORIENTATION=+